MLALSIFYSKSFYQRDYDRTQRSADTVTRLIWQVLTLNSMTLRSVIDIGCGRGVWLDEFSKRGVAHVKGRDGPWVQKANPLVASENFEATDLAKPFCEDLKFDLAMSLEVAEHLDEGKADGFVASLAGLSDTIMFSAAIGGQGGQHHVNEQPLSYWVAKFEGHGFRMIDAIRPHVWNNSDVCWWYRQNIVFFAKDTSPFLPALNALQASAPAIVNLAHPQGFSEKARLANLFSPEEYVGLFVARTRARIARLIGRGQP